MLYVQQETMFSARVLASSGLAITAKVVDPDNAGAELVAPVVAVEAPAGTYTAELVAPASPVDGHALELVWTIPSAPAVSEDLVVTVDTPDVNVAALPDVSEVAAFLRARTRLPGGRGEAGTFTTETRPTRAQVLGIIGIAQSHVAGAVGFRTLSAPIARMARAATALRAAILVELSFFPEQVESGRSPVATLRELYAEELERLERNARDAGDDGDGIGVADDVRLPKFGGVHDPCPTTYRSRW